MKIKITIAMCMMLVSFGSGKTQAQEPSKTQRWDATKSPYVISTFNCTDNNKDELVITGQVVIAHPDDAPDKEPAPEVVIDCPKITFEKGSLMTSMASLRVIGRESIGGFVTVTNNRSRPGKDGVSAPGFDVERAKPDMPKGPSVRNGDHASDDPFNSHGAEIGVRGNDGGNGADGDKGFDGGHGGNATQAGRIILYAGTYLVGTEVKLTSNGAPGGSGALGGIGEKGGKGGDGGDGGTGGNASYQKSANRGGDGGNGGVGGAGGQGGIGGNGGNGANGGDLYAIIMVKDPLNPGTTPAMFVWENNGGGRGIPTGGGPGAKKSDGGVRGYGGCGGQPKKVGDWVVQPGDRCGGQGLDGRPGPEGRGGLMGLWGQVGLSGKGGNYNVGYIPDPGAPPNTNFLLSKVPFIRDPILLDVNQVGGSVKAAALESGLDVISLPYDPKTNLQIGSGLDVDIFNRGLSNCLIFGNDDLVWIDGDGAKETNADMQLITDYHSFARVLSLEVDYKSSGDISIPVLRGGGTLELKTKYKSFVQDEEKSLALVVSAFSDYGRFGLRRYILGEKWQALINDDKHDDFRQQCGTHTIVSARRTAMVAVVISIDNVSTSSKESLQAVYKSNFSVDGKIDLVTLKAESNFELKWRQFIQTASRLGTVHVSFASKGGAGISDALKQKIQADPGNLDQIMAQISDLGSSFTANSSATTEYILLPNTALGVKSRIIDSNKLTKLNNMYVQLARIDFSLKKIGAYRTNLPEMYKSVYLPLEGKLQLARQNVITLIENCIQNEQCHDVLPPIPEGLFIEDIIQPAKVELDCSYKQFWSKDGKFSASYLSSAVVRLTGKGRLTDYVSIPTAVLFRLPYENEGAFNPTFTSLTMSEPDSVGTRELVAHLDIFRFNPQVDVFDSTVMLTNLSQLVEERQRVLTMLYSIEMQAKNGQTIINSVGPSFGGNCPIERMHSL